MTQTTQNADRTKNSMSPLWSGGGGDIILAGVEVTCKREVAGAEVKIDLPSLAG